MWLWLVVILFLLGTGLFVLAPHPPPAPGRVPDVAALASYLQRLVASGSPPGLTVVVVKDGSIVFDRAFGFADGPRERLATPDTVYHWWSMTKVVTAIAVLQLQERGKLKLKDAVTTYLPWFEARTSSRRDVPIRIRDLLQHSSGLPDTMPAMIGWVHSDDGPRDQTAIVRAQLQRFNRLKFTPGESASYSNLNYMLLGAVIESVTGGPYERYIHDHVLEPLGMNATGFVVTGAMAAQEAAGTLPIVHPYTLLLPMLLDMRALVRSRQGKLLWFNRVYIDATPSTGLIGPAHDVARLMLACLNGGILDGVRLLDPESNALFVGTAPPIDHRGLGWVVGGSGSERFLEHGGGGPGFASILRIYPERHLGIAILSNGTDLDRRGLVELVAGLTWSPG